MLILVPVGVGFGLFPDPLEELPPQALKERAKDASITNKANCRKRNRMVRPLAEVEMNSRIPLYITSGKLPDSHRYMYRRSFELAGLTPELCFEQDEAGAVRRRRRIASDGCSLGPEPLVRKLCCRNDLNGPGRTAAHLRQNFTSGCGDLRSESVEEYVGLLFGRHDSAAGLYNSFVGPGPVGACGQRIWPKSNQ